MTSELYGNLKLSSWEPYSHKKAPIQYPFLQLLLCLGVQLQLQKNIIIHSSFSLLGSLRMSVKEDDMDSSALVQRSHL